MEVKNPSKLQIVSIDSEYLADTLDVTNCSLKNLNELAKAYQNVPYNERDVVTEIAELPGNGDDIYQITAIANNFDSFIHIPNISDAEEYGEWLLKKSRKYTCYHTMEFEGLLDHFNFESLARNT